MAVASLLPAAVLYREEQNFDWRVYASLALLDVMAWGALVWWFQEAPDPAGPGLGWSPETTLIALLGLLLPAVAVVLLLRMTTEVSPSMVRVWFGWIPSYRRTVPIAAVRRLEVVTYRPLADYGGWGIRSGRDGERVLNARGNRGVRLELSDGTRLLIGSQRPEDLALAIEQAMRPCV